MTPHVVSIPPGVAFLPTLVDALLEGRLVPGFTPGDDPLALASATIFVPTRRAARTLAATFVGRLNRDAALLPDIRPLGTADADEIAMDAALGGLEAGMGAASLAPAIDPTARHIILTQYVRTWWHSMRSELRDLYGEDEIVVPAHLADAAWFARDLGQLMDSIVTEEADWQNLFAIEAQETGQWWELTLKFLEIAHATFPTVLEQRGLMDGAQRHSLMLKAQLEALRNRRGGGPVIAAGSTGSIPATAELLRHVAHREQGVVVLPGLDREITAPEWARLLDEDESRQAHPQYGLAVLLSKLKTGIDAVETLAEPAEPLRHRERIVTEALRPADATASWARLKLDDMKRDDAFQSVAYVEAANEREEASAIAFAMRETLENPDATVALVTPDRTLARRVSVELLRFGIEADDSAGQPLHATPWGTFAALALRLAAGQGGSDDLVALVKHPVLSLGLDPNAIRPAADAYELMALRGQIVPPAIGSLAAHLADCEARLDPKREHRLNKRLSDEVRQAARDLAVRLDAAFAPLIPGPTGLAGATQATIETLETLAAPHDREDTPWSGDDGAALASFLSDLAGAGEELEFEPTDWPGLFAALAGDRAVRSRGAVHQRALIWGPLEARLQTVDRVVLGGLNEETWPAALRSDAFLSRTMKSQLPLDPPERRIGLAAHDIQMLFGQDDIVLTRAARQGTRPTVASRWWQRINALAGEVARKEMQRRGDELLALVRRADTVETVTPCPRPAPAPPVDVRPTNVSFTEVERWIRDPYSIYARRILNLDAAAPLTREPDMRERGNIYHKIVERFVAEDIDPAAPDAMQRMSDLADQEFERSIVPEEVAALWRPRFDEIAAEFLDWERKRRPDVKRSHVEAWGEMNVAGITVRGIADRIDEMSDGTLAILDYKTGTNPTRSQAEALHAPQLPLEVAAATRHAFKGVDAAETSHLAYVRLRPGNFRDDRIAAGAKAEKDPNQLGQEAYEQIEALARRFADPATPYTSRTRPMRAGDYEGDYDHLARVAEWSDAEEEAS